MVPDSVEIFWVCFIVNAIGFPGVSPLMSNISYTSGATMVYTFPSAIYLPVMPLKRGPTKIPRAGANKGTMKAPFSHTKIYFLFLCDVF